MSEKLRKRCMISLFAAAMLLCFVVYIIPCFTQPTSLYKRSEISYGGFLIGEILHIPLKHYELISPPDYYFCTDTDTKRLLDLIKEQPKVEDIRCLGKWPDESERYLITVKNQSGLSYLELYAVQEEFPVKKGKHSYLLRDGGIMIEDGEEENWQILFPAVIRDENWQDIMYNTAMMEEGRPYKVYAPEGQKRSDKAALADELLAFYENAAMYRVLSHTSDEIIVAFDAKALESNPVNAPKQSDTFDMTYKGNFRIKIGEGGDSVSVTLMQ